MKLFVDTGDVEEVRKAADWGVLDGVTTNPTLIAKNGKPFKEDRARHLRGRADGAISAEIVSDTYDEMLREALEVHSWHPNIVVKVPLIEPGIKLVKELSGRGIRTNVTLVFSVPQALLAAKAGATFVSNFVGRTDDAGGDGMDAVRESVAMVEAYGFESEILAASVRHPLHVLSAVKAGAHVATMGFKTMAMLFQHPLTKNGLQQFAEDWAKGGLHVLQEIKDEAGTA